MRGRQDDAEEIFREEFTPGRGESCAHPPPIAPQPTRFPIRAIQSLAQPAAGLESRQMIHCEDFVASLVRLRLQHDKGRFIP